MRKQLNRVNKQIIEDYITQKIKEDNEPTDKHYKLYQTMQLNDKFQGFLHSDEHYEPREWCGKKVTVKKFTFEDETDLKRWKDINPNKDVYSLARKNPTLKAIEEPIIYKAIKINNVVLVEFVTDVYDVLPERDATIKERINESMTNKINEFKKKGYTTMGGVL